ncbi:MAG: ArsB/NhaD family transporter [Polyangiaceae bacterium]
MRLAGTLIIFVTMLGLVIARPRRWNEAWWTVAGALAMLACSFVSPRQALETMVAGKDALLFLLSLLLLSLLVAESGLFEWAAIRSARLAGGNARSLYRNAFILGAVVTAVLSLDTTAVMLTPIVLALVRRLELPAAPYVILCAFVANVGSLLLPVSNLTNILFAGAFHLSFAEYAAKMAIPQAVALATTYALLRWHFRHQLPERFTASALPEPKRVVPSRAYFLASAAVLTVVLAGYFVAPLAGLEVYVVAFVGCAVLTVVGVMTGRLHVRLLGKLSWSVFPLVIGLFIAVRGVENLGVVDAASAWLRSAPQSAATAFRVALATALAANVVNNLPAALIARSVLLQAGAHTRVVLGALVGADAAPLLTPYGSLATILVFTLARRDGVQIRTSTLLWFGVWAVPVIFLTTTLALLLLPLAP